MKNGSKYVLRYSAREICYSEAKDGLLRIHLIQIYDQTIYSHVSSTAEIKNILMRQTWSA